jgi:gliding motility-associated-like protein
MRGIFIFLLLFISFTGIAQKIDNNWFFGNYAAINFSNNEPQEVVGSALATLEGSASISDENGNLLFYTNGVTVWNKHNQVMENGTGLNGHRSTTQSALILQNPKDRNIFYLFTVGEKADKNGLNYHKVDMNKNNGLGAVIFKNKKVLAPVCEKLAGARHANNKAYWVVVKKWETNIFYSYFVTDIGLKDVVISKTGPVTNDFNNDKQNNEAIGYMVFSNSFKMVALVNNIPQGGEINLYGFDNSSGQLYFYKTIRTSEYVYGVEFSPNEQFIYVTYDRGEVALRQYEISTGKETFKVMANGLQYGALRLAPNQKIYVVKSGKQLDVIENPNGLGDDCNYKKNVFTFSKATNGYGLPNKNVYLPPYTHTNSNDNGQQPNKPEITANQSKAKTINSLKTDTISNLPLCKELKPNLGEDKIICGEKVVLQNNLPNVNVRWNTGDTAQKIIVNNTGYYWLTVNNNKCQNADTIFIKFIHREPDFKFLSELNPDNNGVNAKFIFSISDVEYFEMKVYNKKNKLVFETHNPNEMWDGKKNGKPYPDGDYKFIVKYKSACPQAQLKTEEGFVRISK